MPDVSILIPHKHEPINDAALRVALDCIAANTYSNYELLVDSTTPADPYECLNAMALAARSPWLFFSNSDLFLAPGWDKGLFEHAAPLTMTTIRMVECGAIGVHHQNIAADFGMQPHTFNRQAFERYVAGMPTPPEGNGYYYYLMMARQDFINAGMFDTSKGRWPTPVDSIFWDKWLTDGKRIIRGAGYAYHLQNYSNPAEQTKAVRHGR